MFFSVPVYPAQPSSSIYAVSELYSVKTYDRAKAIAAGVNPPTFDPNKRPKGWAFTNAKALATPAGRVYVWVFNPLTGKMDHVWMPWQEAATFNLPGLHPYPPYVIAATAAFQNTVTGPQTINPATLSTLEEALMLVADWNLSEDSISQESFQGYEVQYPEGENRRQFQVLYKGIYCLAVTKVQGKYAKGIGAPGHWNFDGPEPIWVTEVPDVPPGPSNLSAWQIPCRPLLPNEVAAVATLPGNWLIHKS